MVKVNYGHLELGVGLQEYIDETDKEEIHIPKF
jgi:hypothetical protein